MTSSEKLLKCEMYDNLMIRGYKSDQRILVAQAYTCNSTSLNRKRIPNEKTTYNTAREFPDLADFLVGMLISYYTSQAQFPVQLVVGQNATDPFAVKTPLGWSIVGNSKVRRPIQANHALVTVITSQNTNHIEN